MTDTFADVPLSEDDAVRAAALEHASVPTLMMSIVHLTGDASLLDGPIRPQRTMPGDIEGGVSDADKKRRAALIVMSTHGRTGVRRLVISSVAESPVLPLRAASRVGARRPGRRRG